MAFVMYKSEYDLVKYYRYTVCTGVSVYKPRNAEHR